MMMTPLKVLCVIVSFAVNSYLTKRAQGRSRLGFKNFKKRFFVLTNKGLEYSKEKGKTAQYQVPLSEVLGAEKVGEGSFHLKLVSTQWRILLELSGDSWYSIHSQGS